MKVRLSEADAARLDCPRDVEFDQQRVMGREAIALSKIGWSLERLGHASGGRPVMGDDGKPMHATDENGQVQLDAGGNPVLLLTLDPEALLVMVWLAVRRAKGCDVPWADFDVDIRAVAESLGEEDEPGKAGPKPTRSRTSTSRTRRR